MTDGENFLSRLQSEVQSNLLATEEKQQKLRQAGEEAQATIISMVDSGIRIGDSASMIMFNLEVHPKNGEPFRADTQNAISDTSRPKFVPGAQIFVKYNPSDVTTVVIDRPGAPGSKQRATSCSSCGASQIAEETQLVCVYCGSPLPTPS
jgi:hypothetical protein